METEEVDTALEELESRLERLRALYEQYFLGIEKLEPQIPRKDVDRRIYVLRREKIRNTGKRFKLQTLISRYNTFQQYWQRICREIENGTYKRHLIRAEKMIGPTTLLTAAARRRFGREKALRDSQQPAPEAAPNEAAPAAAAAAPSSDSPRAAAEGPAIPPVSTRPRSRTPTWPGLPTPPPPSAAAPPPPFNAQAIPPVRVPAGIQPPAAPERLAAGPAARTPAPSSPATRPAPSSSPRRNQPFESLELDMDFMGDWDPQTSTKARSSVGGSAQAPAATRGAKPPAGDAQREALDAQREARERAAARAAHAEPAAQKAESPAPMERPAALAQPAARPAAAASGAEARSAASGSIPPSVAPRRLAPPPKPKRDPAAAAPHSVAPSAPPQPPPERRPARPPTERPPAPQAANPAAAAAARARAARPKPGEPVSDGKLRELHQRLAEVSKTAGQPAVSFDGLSRSLRAAEAKLREKHGNRRIDFEVVLKDGKAVVKPVVR